MVLPAPAIARSLARTLLSPAQRQRLRHLRWRDSGHGYDRLGLHPAWVGAALGVGRFFYEIYFRVSSHQAENIPAEGAAILAANHSGMLPLDGAMLYFDVVAHTHPPRVPRIAFDHFVPNLPFASVFFARVGAVSGARATVRRLLDDGELVGLFPEGTPGIGKPWAERYQLQHWRVGHAELAIRHGAPVVPVAIIGAEEQWPQIGRIPWVHAFGAPYLPIPATPVPLPVHYHVWYGEPLRLHERWPPVAADDPEVCAQAAREVKAAVQALIERGLSQRPGVFQ